MANVDDRIVKILQSKKELADELTLDGWKRFLASDDFNFDWD